MVGTRKGAFFYSSDATRRKWKVDGPHSLGQIVHHLVLDPRDGRTLLMAARTGHLGPTVFRSTNWGKSWQEAKQPPAFKKAPEGQTGRAVDHVFWLTPGHPSQPGVWYAGTSPQGLFRSEDGGVTWNGVAGFNEHPMLPKWSGGPGDGTPDGPKLHSILVDPRDPAHMYLGMSSGGVFETLDACASWRPLNKGLVADFLPEKDAEYGHDPHCMALHPLRPDRLYQENHCGVYRLDRPGEVWQRIGLNLPKKIGDIGFPIVLHPRDPDTVWVFPMDGTTVWPRTSPGGRPAVYCSRDAGKTWKRQDQGLPREHAWFTVKRQAFAADDGDPAGLYFGATSGEIWMSDNEGRSWRFIASHLPHIYSVVTARTTSCKS
ncbi:MAG: glycosyl hydrolase [Acidobacteria bacterium]|nr:glycosyl hydrolase [Acidobacteriota bacterium]